MITHGRWGKWMPNHYLDYPQQWYFGGPWNNYDTYFNR